MNKYSIGSDEHGNYIFDYNKVNKDMQAFIKGKKKFSVDLYDVMNLRFTIAHYNIYGWLSYYNGNWSMLADEIENTIHCWHESEEQEKALKSLVAFLKKNNDIEINGIQLDKH